MVLVDPFEQAKIYCRNQKDPAGFEKEYISDFIGNSDTFRTIDLTNDQACVCY